MDDAGITRAMAGAGSNRRARRAGAAAFLAVILAAAGWTPAGAATAGAATAGAAPAATAPGLRQHAAHGLDGRVELLARELALDAGQRVALRGILQEQGVEVARLWDDTSLPGAVRVSRTQAISDRTAERIRALLNEEQRRKYIQPRHRETSVGAPGGRVETWMKPGKAH